MRINQEFRANGGASLLAVPLGALAGSLLVNASKAFVDAGARTKLSGVVVGVTIGLVVLAGVNLPRFIPTPILAGLVLLLGYGMLIEALKSAFNQKSWLELQTVVEAARPFSARRMMLHYARHCRPACPKKQFNKRCNGGIEENPTPEPKGTWLH